MITATCFNHISIIGKSIDRLIECEKSVLAIGNELSKEVFAWCVLPNHYHILLQTDNIKKLLFELGRFHGRSSRKWNLEDKTPGRKVWFNYVERPLKSERHFWEAMNYIHNNPIHHGYVDQWQEWLFSSAHKFLADVGREEAGMLWKKFPADELKSVWD
ncbi:hypothetical protein K8I28_00840 [bacterium]|nr:hypothetical protein [bacterium]